MAQSDEVWQPRISAEDSRRLRSSSEALSALPLRRLYPLQPPANLLRNSMLQRSAQSAPQYGSMAATEPWRVSSLPCQLLAAQARLL